MTRWIGENLQPYMDGRTEPWTVSVLCALIELHRPLRLLELGTYRGTTTREMANVMPTEARIWTVDHEEKHGGFMDSRIEPVTADALEFLADECPDDLDFAFVDDCHEQDHVREELRLLKPRMAPGGIIVMHDVLGRFDLAVVCRENGGFVIELPLLHAAGGLGVVPC